MNKSLYDNYFLYELTCLFSIAWMQFHFDISMDQSEKILLSSNSQQNDFLYQTAFNKKKKQKLNSEEAEKIHRLLIDITKEKDITNIIIDLGKIAKNSSNLSKLFEEAEDFYYEQQQENGIQVRGALTSESETSQGINDLIKLLSKIIALEKMLYVDIKTDTSSDIPESQARLESDTKPQNDESRKIKNDTRKSINELRKLSGLSWEKIAILFDVPLKTICFWASGREITRNEDVEKLDQLLDSIKYIDRGSTSLNRNILLKTLSDGILPLDLLVDSKYQEFKSILGSGTPLKRPELNPLSEESLKLRKPISLENIVDARQETIHKSA